MSAGGWSGAAGHEFGWTAGARSPREEAERLVTVALAAASVAARSTAGFATGTAECCVCPICRALAMMRDPSPEFAERLATGVGDLATGLAAVLRAFGSPTPTPASEPAPASASASASAPTPATAPAAAPASAPTPATAPASVPGGDPPEQRRDSEGGRHADFDGGDGDGAGDPWQAATRTY